MTNKFKNFRYKFLRKIIIQLSPKNQRRVISRLSPVMAHNIFHFLCNQKNLKTMISIAEKLSKGFPYVRIDLYDIGGKVYFSEMTFTPAAGIATYNTDEAFDYFGSLLKLPPKQHKAKNIQMSY